MLTPTSQTQAIPEQRAYHSYGSVPRRASAPRSTTTTPPPASPHREGFSCGTHPEDSPYITDDQSSEDTLLYPQRAPSSARRYAAPTTTTTHVPIAPTRRGHSKTFYTLLVGGSILLGGMLASLVPPVWQRTSDQLTYGYPAPTKPMSMWGTIPEHATHAATLSRSTVTAISRSLSCRKGCRKKTSSRTCI